MKLIKCVSLTPNKPRIKCVACLKWIDFDHAHANLDGVAFVDYYCTPCAQVRIDAVEEER